MILNVYSQALVLLGIGMITVFFILFLVVSFGNIIIRVVNRFLPEQVVLSKTTTGGVKTGIDNKIMAVLVATVNEITGGKGRISNVEKL
jgi:oxaloacetate decarboxylase gamma subunit